MGNNEKIKIVEMHIKEMEVKLLEEENRLRIMSKRMINNKPLLKEEVETLNTVQKNVENNKIGLLFTKKYLEYLKNSDNKVNKRK